MEKRYYYKTQDGKNYFSLKEPKTGYIEISQKEFENHLKELLKLEK